MVKRKRNPVLSGILTAVFTAAGILFLTVIVSLFLDEKRAGSLVKKLYPAAELLDTMPTSQILRSDVACLLYDSEYHLAFQQNVERSWFRMRASEQDETGFDAALERHRQMDEVLAAFAEQTTVPYLAFHASDSCGVCIYTTEQDPDILTEMHGRLLSLQAQDAVQSFSVVSCSAEAYAHIRNTTEDEFIRSAAELSPTAGGFGLRSSSSDPARMLGFGKADTKFTWEAKSVREAYEMRASYIADGKMNEYPEFKENSPLIYYCDVLGTPGSVQSGVRQWAVSGKTRTYNSKTKRWEYPVGQSYIFKKGE
ncbi:MAG: hypothetical protein K6E36_01970 [Oscillospiraceae bacterium]|nr:hypothetical protein [Oscillospiraceae bacterium]MCR5305255.1 hypothetical protein [Oscillospiraceae bacterium]